MLTREQIEEIQSESREKGVSLKRILEEKGIPSHQYFWWKRKYSKQKVAEGFFGCLQRVKAMITKEEVSAVIVYCDGTRSVTNSVCRSLPDARL